MEKEQELIGKLLANTRKASKARALSILDIANDITQLVGIKGSLKSVAAILNITENMLNKFLAVYKLNEDVKTLVVQRKIDSVEVVYSIAKFRQDVQTQIARYVVENKLSSQDVRALSPFIKNNPGKDINVLIDTLLHSKNIKVSVLHFYLKESFNKKTFEEAIKQLIGQNNIVTFEYNGNVGTLKIKKSGEKLLRVKAKEQKMSLEQLITTLMN